MSQVDFDKKRKRFARLITVCFVAVATFVFLVGPWPAIQTHYKNDPSVLATFKNLDQQPVWMAHEGELLFHYAEIEISPEIGEALGGFSARQPKAAESINRPLLAQALTIQRGDLRVTLLSVDMLLIFGDLTRDLMNETGLKPEELFITASHTHAGPGAWHEGAIPEFLLGNYDPAVKQKLLDRLVKVVAESRDEVYFNSLPVGASAYGPPMIKYFEQWHPDLEENRIHEDEFNYGKFAGLVFSSGQQGQAGGRDTRFADYVWLSFGAHPTLVGPDEKYADPDYPGYLRDIIARTSQPEVKLLFAAGAMGHSRVPNTQGTADPKVRGRKVAEQLMQHAFELSFPVESDQSTSPLPVISSQVAQVELPIIQMVLLPGVDWKLSPLFVKMRVGELASATTIVRVLKIGEVVIVGMPGDYGGTLAKELDDWCKARGLHLILTSFNGDYKGYFTHPDYYPKYAGYETRRMNFGGRYGGEYLKEVAQRMIEKAMQAEEESGARD